MVEMLGVLAVVGVLSVGGIAGYTYAMNKHYANELLMGASERAVLVTAQIASGRKPSLKEFANHTTAGGTFATDDESVRVYTDGVGIPVSGVKGAVCENLIKATDGTDTVFKLDALAMPENLFTLGGSLGFTAGAHELSGRYEYDFGDGLNSHLFNVGYKYLF